MVQNALSAAKAGPCSRVKKISATTESWGVAAMRAPRRGPSRSTAAVTPRTKPDDTTILAIRKTIQEEPGVIARAGGLSPARAGRGRRRAAARTRSDGIAPDRRG